jgi:hypothetical protein
MSQEMIDQLRRERADAATARREARKAARVTPVVALRRVRCPDCGSTAIKTTRTLESEPEIVSRRQSCQSCGCAFIAIFD